MNNYEDKEAVITGYFPKIHEHETYIFYGELKDHPKFGLQFHTTHFRKDMPQTKQGVVSYFQVKCLKGLARKQQRKLLIHLVKMRFRRYLNQPSLLDSVPKLPPEKAKDLYDTLMEHQGLEQAMIALNQYGFGPQLSMKIYQAYKEMTIDIMQKNPYKLVEDVEGIGFGRADELGHQLGITGNHPDRIKAGCLYILRNRMYANRTCFYSCRILLATSQKLLEENKRDQIEFTDIYK